MNEQDKAAFEKWWKTEFIRGVGIAGNEYFESPCAVALRNRKKGALQISMKLLEQERERSRRLIEALENCLKIFSLSGSARTILNKALQEYRGSND